MKIYANTGVFDKLFRENNIVVTSNPADSDILVLGAKKVNFLEFIKLKCVYRFGVGVDNIDFGLLKKKNIPLYFPSESTKRILYDATANFTVCGILNMLYQGAFGNAQDWKKAERDYLGNKTALVIGTGNIGKRVVDKLRVFMNVVTYDIVSNKPDELESLVRKADIITVHIPLNENTRNFFDSAKLAWVKDDALILNTARGELFDESALFDKLRSSNCRAFFDVFWQEPYDGKLKSLGSAKFFMTPHSASNTKEFVREGFRDILRITKELQCKN